MGLDMRLNKVTEVAYWRKANAIHRWFVENVQDGEDDCKSYPVADFQLEELLERCKKVLAASKLVKGKIENGKKATEAGWEPIMQEGEYIEDSSVAEELLPTQEGFFFGSQAYDQYYIEDIKNTIEMLEPLLKEADTNYEYQSSW